METAPTVWFDCVAWTIGSFLGMVALNVFMTSRRMVSLFAVTEKTERGMAWSILHRRIAKFSSASSSRQRDEAETSTTRDIVVEGQPRSRRVKPIVTVRSARRMRGEGRMGKGRGLGGSRSTMN